MKQIIKKTGISVVALLLIFTSINANAFRGTDKTIEKARAAVKKAAPDDWEAYAKAAKMCITKKVNLPEAKEWLDKSLEIKESALGNEVAGDYYASNKLYDQAIKHYVKGMLKLKEKDINADTSDIQKKIEEAKGQL